MSGVFPHRRPVRFFHSFRETKEPDLIRKATLQREARQRHCVLGVKKKKKKKGEKGGEGEREGQRVNWSQSQRVMSVAPDKMQENKRNGLFDCEHCGKTSSTHLRFAVANTDEADPI